jgi:predicted PurR-regulated permease PerM
VNVAAPLFEPILLAAAIAILTSPVLSAPLDRFVDRKFPRLSDGARRRISGVTCTVIVVLFALTPLFLAVVSQVDHISELADRVKGIITRDPTTIAAVADAVAQQVRDINAHYTKLGLPADEIGAGVREFLTESQDVNSAVLSFILAGTGTLAHVALALVSLTYFYIDGARLVRSLLSYSPLSRDQRARLIDQHRRVVLRLLNDTIATAFVKGVVLGGIVWVVDHTLGSGALPFLPVAIVAALITLLPMVGVTMVWLPFAGLAWSQDNRLGAVALALTCWTSNFVLDRYREKVSSRLERHTEWLGFLLFLGVVGGLLTYGPKGLIIGPFAVVLVITVFRAWLPLYVAAPPPSAVPALDLPIGDEPDA